MASSKTGEMLSKISTDVALLLQQMSGVCLKTEEHEHFINGSNGTPGAKTTLQSHTDAIARMEGQRKESKALWGSILLLFISQIVGLISDGIKSGNAAQVVSAVAKFFS